MEPLELAEALAATLVEHKAEEVTILDLSELSDTFDAFVIASSSSETHRRALIETTSDKYRQLSGYRGRIEGAEAAGWVLLDCSDVVVHVMSAELRDYYELEEFWGDAPRIILDP